MKNNPNAQLRETVRKIIAEAMPSMERIDPRVAEDAMDDYVSDLTMEIAQEVIFRFHKQLEPVLLDALNDNLVGVETPTAGPTKGWDRRVVRQALASVEEQLMDDQMECASDIEAALRKYATLVARAIGADAHGG